MREAMAFQLYQLAPLPRLCCILLLLSTISFSRAEKKCQYPGSDPDQRRNRNYYTMDDSDAVFHVRRKSGLAQKPLHQINTTQANSTRVLSTMDGSIKLCQWRSDRSGVDESSFSITVFMRNQTTSGNRSVFSFLILPDNALHFSQINESLPLAKQLAITWGKGYQLNLSNRTTQTGSIPHIHGHVFMATGTLSNPARTGYDNGKRAMGVGIVIRPPVSNYSVWIDYNPVGGLSMYMDVEGKPKPASPIAEAPFNISSVVSAASPFVYFGLLTTLEQRLRTRGIHFSAMVDNLPDKGGLPTKKATIIISAVLGSVAATAVMAMAVAFYFNSRYRRWHKELSQLAKSMERLPGVPTKVDFADINKATNHFHETMKLGGGGFGTVYRCTLTATASKMNWPIDVAVKRFTREVQNRRYGDFLAEVSIINGLRHKNIVPLVGWSYNKGEPLLVFEYMTNGSLDQHLFHKGGTSSRGHRSMPLRHTGKAIRRWATRYEIVRDIATGLHYVHHEYEPMVLHRDIKASNVMIDSSFRARLGDFGLACTVAVDRNSATGVAGTWGYIAPEYAIRGKATRQTDVYALGVLILELVTGKRALDGDLVVNSEDMHITDWVWGLHCEGRLLECVDVVVLTFASKDEDEEDQVDNCEDATRLLLLGLACSHPNPSDRPTMPDVMQVITKSAPPPEVPRQKPTFVWPPPGGWTSDDDETIYSSMMSDLDRSRDEQQVGVGPQMQQVRTVGRYVLFQPRSAQERAIARHVSFQIQHSV